MPSGMLERFIDKIELFGTSRRELKHQIENLEARNLALLDAMAGVSADYGKALDQVRVLTLARQDVAAGFKAFCKVAFPGLGLSIELPVGSVDVQQVTGEENL